MSNHKEVLDAYLKKIEIIDDDYVDQLERLLNFYGNDADFADIKFALERINEFIPYLKKYQEQYQAYIRARESARGTLFGTPQCVNCGCRSCMCYLNEPG